MIVPELSRGFVTWNYRVLVYVPFARDDVWFVTMTQALLWMTDPVPISQIGSLEDWDCRKRQNIPTPPCNLPNSCRLTFKPPKGVDSAWLAGTR